MVDVLRYSRDLQQAEPETTRTGRSVVEGIRPRRQRDLGACVRLLRVVFYEDHYPFYWPDGARSWLEDGVEAWVVESRGEILGHVSVNRVGIDPFSALRWRESTGREPADLAAVSRLFVRPRVRGQGFGTTLLDVAVAGIRSRGLMPVMEVVSANGPAVDLVEHLGWRMRAMYPWGDRSDRLQVYFYEPRREAGAHRTSGRLSFT